MLDVMERHGQGGEAAQNEILAWLERVDLDRNVVDAYPHELSGGMLQRVCLAMSMLLKPRLLLLDEPTTALDAVNRAGVLDLITSACATGAGVLLVTHDFAAVRGWAQQIAVMWRGRLVEAGPASQVLSNPTHPYTAALLECVPKGDTGPLIDVEQVLEAARRRQRRRHARRHDCSKSLSHVHSRLCSTHIARSEP